jgi:hypothetical protein
MRWSQAFDASVSQTFSPQVLEKGGKLAIRLSGTMKGTGSESWSNCRSAQGSTCPPARSGSYSYPIEVIGNLDLDAQTGNGTLVVSKVPLATGGTWRAPAEATP